MSTPSWLSTTPFVLLSRAFFRHIPNDVPPLVTYVFTLIW